MSSIPSRSGHFVGVLLRSFQKFSVIIELVPVLPINKGTIFCHCLGSLGAIFCMHVPGCLCGPGYVYGGLALLWPKEHSALLMKFRKSRHGVHILLKCMNLVW